MSSSTEGGGGPGDWSLSHNFKKKTCLNNDKICLCLNHLIGSKHSPTLAPRRQAFEGLYPSFIPKYRKVVS